MAGGEAGDGRLRASDADREQVVDILKTAFVQGRLTKDELGARAGQALASRTYAELTTVTADIPAGRIQVPPPPKPIGHRPGHRSTEDGRVERMRDHSPAVLGAAFFTYYGGFFVVFLFAFLGVT